MYTDKSKSYTIKEVSRLFGVNEDTVRRMIKDGRLDAEKIKARYHITEESIKRLVKEGIKK